MKEIRDIIKAFEAASQENKKAALATVVHVEGSSYRRPGARMLVTEDGLLTGAISGGCLEGDALRKALAAIMQQENKLVVYDSMEEDDLKFGVQLGCNGIVHILFEPINKSKAGNPIALLQMLVSGRGNAVLVTMYSTSHSWHPGSCLLYEKDKIQSALAASFTTDLMPSVVNTFQNRQSCTAFYKYEQQQFHAFIEFVPPPVSLVIAGAGNDVMPLTEMAYLLGWDIVIVDGRKGYATAKRFVKANKLITAKPGELLRQIDHDANTAFLLMTHNYNYDIALLKELLATDCAYIGILGPKKKLEKMIAELADENIRLNEKQRKIIHGPAGLNIGAETPEEIALSIIAEIKAFLSGRDGTTLKNIDEPIHARAVVDQ